MSNTLTTLLFTGAYALPMIVTLIVGLGLVATSPASATRRIALSGLALILVGMLGGVVQAVMPTLLMERGDSISAIGMVSTVLGGVLVLINVVGLALVIWALRRALRAVPAG